MEKKKEGIPRLLELAGTKKILFIISCIFSILSGLLQIIPFVSIYKIVEEFFIHAQSMQSVDHQKILYWGFVAFLSLFASVVTIYISAMCSHIGAFTILYELRLKLAAHVAKVPMGYHTKTASGELKKIIEVSVEKIEKFLAHQLPDLVTAVVIPLFLVGYMYFLDWRLALATSVIILAGMSIQSLAYGNDAAKEMYRKYQFTSEEMNATGVEYVRGMPAVKIFGITADSFLTFKRAVNQYKEVSLEITFGYKLMYCLFFTVIGNLFVFLLPVGVLLMNQDPTNQAVAITFVLFLLVTPSLTAPLLKLMYLGGSLREISEGTRRMDEVFAEPVVTEPLEPVIPSNYEVAFHHVNFAYELKESQDYKQVLSDVNFVAKVGQVTALVGPSGGGKSTIANLLLRFWDIQQGTITIGEVPIQEMGTEKLMDTVAFVFQDVHLFYDTVEENIRMGNQTATQEQVIAAAKLACCDEFIEKLDQGYQTKIGEGGTNLSGGEAQRISIARAILKDAPILVLDEATSYADAENESKIQQGIEALVKGKTVLMIAHRLSTIRNAEQILVIKEGKIVEQGTHDQLREEKGLYERMWEAHIAAATWKISAKQRQNSCIVEREGGI